MSPLDHPTDTCEEPESDVPCHPSIPRLELKFSFLTVSHCDEARDARHATPSIPHLELALHAPRRARRRDGRGFGRARREHARAAARPVDDGAGARELVAALVLVAAPKLDLAAAPPNREPRLGGLVQLFLSG